MSSPSVSFRISRSAEDLAGTLHLLSQRLVQLEQRLAALEAIGLQAEQPDPALDRSLGNAERLLLDCRSLLEGALEAPPAALPGPAPEVAAHPAAPKPDPRDELNTDRGADLEAELDGDPEGELATDLDAALEDDRDGPAYRTSSGLLKAPNGRAAA
jgi:hypothetical protein